MTMFKFPETKVDIFTLPTCPPGIKATVLQSPSTFILYSLVCFSSVVYAILVLFQYNAVRLPYLRRRVRSKTIRNHMWILYFTFVALKAILSAIRYAKPVDLDLDKKYLFGMSITETIFHALTAFFLTLALNYQRTWRSGNSMVLRLSGDDDDVEDDLSDVGAVVSPHRSSTNTRKGKKRKGKKPVSNSLLVDDDSDESDYDDTQSDDESESDSQLMLGVGNSSNRREGKSASEIAKAIVDYVLSLYFVALVLLLLVLLSVIFRASNLGNQTEAHKWIQFSLLLVQRLPILILAVLILFSKRVTAEGLEIGPTILSRVILGFALLLNLPNDIPLGYWFLFFKDTTVATKCVLYLGNAFDIIVFLYLVSLVLWFLFLRFEYIRNQEAAMFAAMQKTQNVFDVRFD